MIRMALGTATASGILPRPAVFVAVSAGVDPGQEDVGGFAAFWCPVVARRARQQAVGIVAEFRVQEPAPRNRRLRNRWQRPATLNHYVAELATFVE